LKAFCVSRDPENWLPLLVEGSELRSCLIRSSGKRGFAYLVTVEYPPLCIPLSHHVLFGALEGVEQRLLSLDDVNVGLMFHPIEGTRVRLAEAKVDFWLEDEKPVDFLAPPKSGQEWELNAAFNTKLGFEVFGSSCACDGV
jgi:hypothetical protein